MAKVNPVTETTLAAVAASVEHVPKCVILAVPLNATPSIVLAVANFVADPALPVILVLFAIAVSTYFVDAIWSVFVFCVAVGTVGTPVKVGLFNGAFKFNVSCKFFILDMVWLCELSTTVVCNVTVFNSALYTNSEVTSPVKIGIDV